MIKLEKNTNKSLRISACYPCSSAFTLIELLITVAILTVVAAVGGVNFFNYYSRQNLTSAANEIVAILRQAQNSSVSQENGDQWGVRFLNATTTHDLIQLFRGSSFASGALVISQELPAGVQFINPVSGASMDVIFSKVTGYPNAAVSIKLALIAEPNTSSTVVISIIGRVSKP